ncbi:MAG: hypothetical protein WBV61_09765 [Rhodanobacteraceae bacterium]
MSAKSASFAILAGGLVAGALDIAYAISFWSYRGIAPERVLQSVASGLLGKPAFDGGLHTEALGLGLHFFIAFVFAAIFWFASRRIPVLVRRAAVCGVVYGLVVFAVMHTIVLPLSAFPFPQRYSLLGTGTDLLSHMFLFGLPIALATRKASTMTDRRNRPT